ncbi:MAG: tetratricopeptide repeat protein [Deltaproteobacteria bacterium]|nr:MAG: tetratricopeptide repeat protein [Deltaproteobacteria bacterium]
MASVLPGPAVDACAGDRPGGHRRGARSRADLRSPATAASEPCGRRCTAAGAVVEQEIVIADREPPVAGSVDVASLGSFAPTSSTVISYSAPVSAKIHHVERKLPAAARVRHQVANGRETWIHEIAEVPGSTDYDINEINAPADAVTSPYVGVGTAASWEAVARAYGKLLDQRIAEGPVDLPAELPRTASIEAVHAIVAWLHRRVHSSGAVEAIRVPAAPAETVKRGVGDSCDRATLLVALLRQAQIRADLALIEAGWGRQPDPDLPGMGQFDRALVRVRIGARELWIDPTEEMGHPGQLPAYAQGRRVLVIADDTKSLAMTPMSAASDNVIRDVRTFVAGEHGLAQLTQVVRYGGVFEADQRRRVHAARGDALKRMYGARVGSMFGGTLERVASSNAEDLTAPFEVTVSVKDTHRVGTELTEIELYLSPNHTFERLPWIVTQPPDKPRNHDFVWPTPHIYEIENRIVVPPGFTLPAPAAERSHPIGSATFTERQQIDGQTLIVTFRLDTGKPRLTPAELAALQKAVQELRDETVHIKLDNTAFALGVAGKPREAVAEGERLIALHPGDAVHHSQLAMVLMRAGAGEAARREARKAVAMAPGDPAVLVALGWTLTFDTLGRQYTFDWDRAGAIAALQQARKLDPKHLGAAVTLAYVLQRDALGRLYDGADLAGAAEAWRAAQEIRKTDEHALALAQVLAWSGQFAEAEKVARATGAGDERDRWIVVAVAGKAGARPAIAAASDLRSGDGRNPLLQSAAWALLFLQHYDLARELLVESGAMARTGTTDPRSVVLDALAALIDPARKTPVFWDADLERSLRGQAWQLVPAGLRPAMSAHWLKDVLQSVTTVEIEGDGGVWRAAVDEDGKKYQLYLALDRGVVKLIGATDALAAVGRYILRGNDARAQLRARKLLDWIRADVEKVTAGDIVSFKRLWGPGMPSSPDAIQLAAAVLADSTDPDRVIPIVSRCASTLPDAELTCHETLYSAYFARGRWAEAAAQFDAILAQRPGYLDRHARIYAWLLSRAGRADEAERMLDEVLAKDPNHHGALVARFEAAALRGATAEIDRRADALVNHPAATPQDFNYVAWYRLGGGGDLTSALELARKGVDKLPRNANVVNTLAAIEAERGELDAALQDNWRALSLRDTAQPTDGDWYVVGRIEEQLGLAADAAAAYRRVTRPPNGGLLDTYTLAQRRLAAMRAAH